MSAESVELVRSSLEHYLTTGEPAVDTLNEDIEAPDHYVMNSGEYRGAAGFQRWLEDWAGPWSEFSLEPEQYLDAGDQVVAEPQPRASGKASGVTVARQDAMVCTMRDGRMVRLDYYNNPAQALEQVGLE